MKNHTKLCRLFTVACVCLISINIQAVTELHVETAGTLSTLMSNPDKEVKLTGFINGSDIKYLRQLVAAGTVTSLDWSGVRIVSGGQAYFESYTTEKRLFKKRKCSMFKVLPFGQAQAEQCSMKHTTSRAAKWQP